MIRFNLNDMANATGGELRGTNTHFDMVNTDTRTLQADQLFVALRGPNFDGHHYLAQALQVGASGAVVDHPTHCPIPQIVVKDTRLALGDMAKAWRKRASARFIGITGSNGKTTLKEMIAAILSQHHAVLATRGNLNNDIGAPITLMQVQEQDYAVIEMGANHAGEIGYLSRIVQPEIAVLNNAGRAHLEGFGSLAGVAHAKAEIIQGIPAGGCFIYNADDRFAPLWRELADTSPSMTFGVREPADIHSPANSYRIEWHEDGFAAAFAVNTPSRSFNVRLQLAGEHNRLNALAAITVAEKLNINTQDIQQGLAELQPVSGRLRLLHASHGARLIDDSYNANNESVGAALQVLQGAPGKRTLVLGDLAELGENRIALHAEIGQRARAIGIDRLLSCGSLSRHASQAFGQAARHFDNQTDLINFIRDDLTPDDTLLIKGSRSAAMDQVVRALRHDKENRPHAI